VRDAVKNRVAPTVALLKVEKSFSNFEKTRFLHGDAKIVIVGKTGVRHISTSCLAYSAPGTLFYRIMAVVAAVSQIAGYRCFI